MVDFEGCFERLDNLAAEYAIIHRLPDSREEVLCATRSSEHLKN